MLERAMVKSQSYWRCCIVLPRLSFHSNAFYIIRSVKRMRVQMLRYFQRFFWTDGQSSSAIISLHDIVLSSSLDAFDSRGGHPLQFPLHPWRLQWRVSMTWRRCWRMLQARHSSRTAELYVWSAQKRAHHGCDRSAGCSAGCSAGWSAGSSAGRHAGSEGNHKHKKQK